MTRSITQIEEMEMNGVYLIELDGKLKVMVPRTPKCPTETENVSEKIWKNGSDES